MGLKKRMKEYDDRNKLGEEEKHVLHYQDRLKAPAEVLRLKKTYVTKGTTFDDLLKEGSTHQDIQGSNELHAAHKVGLGLKQGAIQKYVKPEGQKEITDLLGYTNPADRDSNVNIERSMDKHIAAIVKKHWKDENIDEKALAKELSDLVDTDVNTKNKQQPQTRGSSSFAKYGPLFKKANEAVQNPSSIKKSSEPPSKKPKIDAGNTVSAGAA